MATKIPPDKIKVLQQAGLSLQTILAYQDGRLSPSTAAAKKIDSILGTTNPRVSVLIPSQPATNFPRPVSDVLPKGSGPAGRTYPVGNVVPPGLPGKPTGPVRTYLPPTRTRPTTDVLPKGSGPPSKSNQLPDVGPAPTLPDAGPFPGAPSYPDLQVPELVIRDWLDQAKQQYAAAYAPLYQSLDMGKANATANQQRSDQVVAGLYSGLAGDIATAGQQQAQDYKDAGAQSQAVAQALQDKIGQIYGGSNQQEMDLAKSLGQEAAGASVIAGNAGERQFQQAEAATSGANQQNFYNQGAQASKDYATQMGTAANTEGAARRSDLQSQLNNILSGYDQQKLGYQSEEARGAINQSNVLSERDLQQQQNRINTILQEAGITDSRIASQYDAAVKAYEAKYGVAKDQYAVERQNYEDQVAQRKAQEDALAKAAADAAAAAQQKIENQQKDTSLIIDATSAGLSIDPSTGQVIPGPGGTTPGTIAESPSGKFTDLATEGQIQSQASARDPQHRPGTQYTDLLKSIAFDPNFVLDKQAAYTFQQEAARRAQQNGLDPQAASDAAFEYWTKILGRH